MSNSNILEVLKTATVTKDYSYTSKVKDNGKGGKAYHKVDMVLPDGRRVWVSIEVLDTAPPAPVKAAAPAVKRKVANPPAPKPTAPAPMEPAAPSLEARFDRLEAIVLKLASK